MNSWIKTTTCAYYILHSFTSNSLYNQTYPLKHIAFFREFTKHCQGCKDVHWNWTPSAHGYHAFLMFFGRIPLNVIGGSPKLHRRPPTPQLGHSIGVQTSPSRFQSFRIWSTRQIVPKHWKSSLDAVILSDPVILWERRSQGWCIFRS